MGEVEAKEQWPRLLADTLRLPRLILDEQSIAFAKSLVAKRQK